MSKSRKSNYDIVIVVIIFTINTKMIIIMMINKNIGYMRIVINKES